MSFDTQALQLSCHMCIPTLHAQESIITAVSNKHDAQSSSSCSRVMFIWEVLVQRLQLLAHVIGSGLHVVLKKHVYITPRQHCGESHDKVDRGLKPTPPDYLCPNVQSQVQPHGQHLLQMLCPAFRSDLWCAPGLLQLMLLTTIGASEAPPPPIPPASC